MALSAYLDALNVTTGAATTTTARSGFGFQPKATIIVGNKRTGSVNAEGVADSGFSVGVFTGTSERYCVGVQSDQNAGTSATDKGQRDDALLMNIGIGGTTDALTDLSSVDADGLTYIEDDAWPTAFRRFALSIGGADVTNVKAGVFAVTTGVASQSITAPGFQPDAGVFLCIGDATIPNAAVENQASVGIAAGATPTNAVVSCLSEDANTNTDTYGYGRGGDCVFIIDNTGSALARGHISSWDTNGFTISWDTQPSTAYQLIYLVVKGGSYAVKTGLTQTDTTTDITLSSVGFTTKAGFMISACSSEHSAGTPGAIGGISFGAFSGTGTQKSLGWMDRDAQGTSSTGQGQREAECYDNLSVTSTLDGAMNVTALGSDSVTLRMTDADPAQSWFAVLLMGDAAAAGGTVTHLIGSSLLNSRLTRSILN